MFAIESYLSPLIEGATITTNFLARTSGLDATHINAYTTFINGLVADNVCTDTTWGKFDCLYILATQDSTTALLNLPSATYNATAVNSPTFTADQGYTGGSTKYISTGFIPSSAGGNYTQDAASIGCYYFNSRTSAATRTGIGVGTGAGDSELTPWYDANRYFCINDNGASSGIAVDDIKASWFLNRTASNHIDVYRNGSSYTTTSTTTIGLAAVQMTLLAQNRQTGIPAQDGPDTVAAAWIGGTFTATEVSNFSARLNTLATTLGWNAY